MLRHQSTIVTLVEYDMPELTPDNQPENELSHLKSKEAYALYLEEVFDQLESERDPAMLDLAANELLLIVIRHEELSPAERLLQMATVSHFTMTILRKFSASDSGAETVHKAEMVHEAYAQLYGQSIVELAKLGASKEQSAAA